MALDGVRPASSRLAATIVTVLAAACGGQTTTTPAAHTATPTPHVAITVAFTVTIPYGWSDVTGDPRVATIHPSGPVLVVLQKPPEPPITSGVNDVDGVIVITEIGQPLSAAQVPQYLQSVRAGGATDITQPLPTTVGATAGTSVTYTTTLQGTAVQTEDIVVAHGGTMYEIELITSRYAFAAQARDLDQLLSDGWSWVRGD